MKYKLYDLAIEVVGDPATFNCSHRLGDGLLVRGENLYLKPGTEYFSHYALAALMPFIAAKQRTTQAADWMYFETDIACPDPQCGARFRFSRTGRHVREYTP